MGTSFIAICLTFFIKSHDNNRCTKRRKSTGFFEEIDLVDGNSDDKNENEKPRNNKFMYEEEWGELYNGKISGRIFMFDRINEKFSSVENIPENVSCAEVNFAPNDEGLIFIAYDIDNPRRLGLKYCYNRNCALYFIPSSKNTSSCSNKFEKLTPQDKLIRSIRISQDGKYVVFLSAKPSMNHFTCSSLEIF